MVDRRLPGRSVIAVKSQAKRLNVQTHTKQSKVDRTYLKSLRFAESHGLEDPLMYAFEETYGTRLSQ